VAGKLCVPGVAPATYDACDDYSSEMFEYQVEYRATLPQLDVEYIPPFLHSTSVLGNGPAITYDEHPRRSVPHSEMNRDKRSKKRSCRSRFASPVEIPDWDTCFEIPMELRFHYFEWMLEQHLYCPVLCEPEASSTWPPYVPHRQEAPVPFMVALYPQHTIEFICFVLGIRGEEAVLASPLEKPASTTTRS
jgi:hypothetical protein